MNLDTSIVAVTVYPGQARVTRRGTVRLPVGRHDLLVTGLPLATDRDSVRVNGLGAAAVSGVDVRTERRARTDEASEAALRQRLDALREQLAELADADAVQRARAELITGVLRRSGRTFAQALAARDAQPDDLAATGDALGGQLAEVLTRQRAIAEDRRRTQEEHDQVDREIADRQQHQPDRQAVSVDLDVAEETELVLEVSYVVSGASWSSGYDLRLRSGQLRLTWFAMITQRTGEDWPECDLRLSTARPAGTTTIPELDPWYLDQLAPPPKPIPTRAFAAAMPSGAAADESFGGPPQLMPVVATAEHGTVATTYRPAHPVAVAANGTAHRTTVTEFDLDAQLDHVVVPLRGQDVHLRATVVNGSSHTLLPGRAALFHETEFVGSTELEPWAPGEELELALGIDDRVRVERELVGRGAGKAVLGGTRKQHAEYKITVGNHTGRPARISVLDQLPVSVHEGIVVRDVHCVPEPAERTELGELTWRLALDAGQQAEIVFGFRVDVAKGVTLSGWRD